MPTTFHAGVASGLNVKHAITGDVGGVDFHRQRLRTALLLVHLNHFAHGGSWLNDVIGKRDDKIVFIVIQIRFSQPHGVTPKQPDG